MQITFVSNYINHHQIPFSDCMYELTKGNYTFIQTEPMEEERIKMGWDASAVNKPYVKLYYENKEACEALIMNSDCVIFGGCEDESIILPRIEARKFTIRYSERIYKQSRLKFISPRGLKKKYHDHIRFRKYPVYMLCAGAYVKGDFSLIHAYKGKMLKYGYFPQHMVYEDLNELRRDNERTQILWAGRFIDWKHPEMMITLARDLKASGIDACISMVGNGPLFEEIKKSAEDLEDYISFVGSKTPEEVRTCMRCADIFISTSDRQEGWGAVINEAMNAGCVTLAAREIGAAPYLIQNDYNGYKYHACSNAELFNLVTDICANPAKARRLGENAYKTVINLWNADVAAKRVYEFILDEKHDIHRYEEGPLSPA